MRFLLEPARARGLDDLLSHGRAALRAGFDGVLLRPGRELPAPLISAAALGGALETLLVAVDVTIGDRHPIELAEEAAVVDLGLGGRLVLGVRPDPEAREGFAEALDLLRTAFAARPFRWEGSRWKVPANLPQNVNNPERQVRVSPAPYQPRMEIWGCGEAAAATVGRGMGHLSDPEEALEAVAGRWAEAEGLPSSIGAPRVRRHGFAGAARLREELLDGRRAFGQDWAVVAGDAEVAEVVGREVRPDVQLDALPPGLTDFWQGRTRCRS